MGKSGEVERKWAEKGVSRCIKKKRKNKIQQKNQKKKKKKKIRYTYEKNTPLKDKVVLKGKKMLGFEHLSSIQW